MTKIKPAKKTSKINYSGRVNNVLFKNNNILIIKIKVYLKLMIFLNKIRLLDNIKTYW